MNGIDLPMTKLTAAFTILGTLFDRAVASKTAAAVIFGVAFSSEFSHS